MSHLFVSGGQNIGASALETVLSMITQDLFHLGLTGSISLLSRELSRVFSSNIVQTILLKPLFFTDTESEGEAQRIPPSRDEDL
jgi:hypothetical protein